MSCCAVHCASAHVVTACRRRPARRPRSCRACGGSTRRRGQKCVSCATHGEPSDATSSSGCALCCNGCAVLCLSRRQLPARMQHAADHIADADGWMSLQAAELQRQLQLRDLVISRLVPQAEAHRVRSQNTASRLHMAVCASYMPATCTSVSSIYSLACTTRHRSDLKPKLLICRLCSRHRGTRTAAAGACWSLQMCRGWSRAWTLVASSLLTLRRPNVSDLLWRCWRHHHGSCGHPDRNWAPQVCAHSLRTV